jgi:dihydrofolate synthase/folylpolyglutamate synthase
MKFRNYKDCINFLFSLERAGIKYDLKNITSLLNYLGNPQSEFKSIHIAGTNGKGSVAAILNSILMESGFKTGLFTSPHLTDMRERFLVNGNYISKNFIIDFTNSIFDKITVIRPSFFEVTTALAFQYFREKKVDYAVIETGLGGRLDSTNVIKPVISIITGIGIEHTEYLGDTIESITGEKGGIIKKGIPVVAGKVPEASREILRSLAVKKGSEIIFADKISRCEITKRDAGGFIFNYYLPTPLAKGALLENLQTQFKKGSSGELRLNQVRFPVIGDFQRENIKTALTALDKLYCPDIPVSEKIIINGFKNIKENSKLHGRFEIISKNPFIVADVSHNAQGIKNLKHSLKYINYDKLFIIFGMMEDKDYRKCLNEIERLGGEIILTKPGSKPARAADPEKILEAARSKYGVKIIENVKAGYDYVRGKMKKNDLLLVTGSFYLAGEFLRDWKK